MVFAFKGLKHPYERLCCQVQDYFYYHNAAGIEAYPYLGFPGDVGTLDEKGAGIIDTGVSECRSLLHSNRWQR